MDPLAHYIVPLRTFTSKFPKRIRVSNLPFWLRGWNQVFEDNGTQANGYPVYELKSYRVFGIIHIPGALIWRNRNDIWIMTDESDFLPECPDVNSVYFKWGNQDDPVGFWSDDVVVESVEVMYS